MISVAVIMVFLLIPLIIVLQTDVGQSLFSDKETLLSEGIIIRKYVTSPLFSDNNYVIEIEVNSPANYKSKVIVHDETYNSYKIEDTIPVYLEYFTNRNDEIVVTSMYLE